jgi:hypothetical protein
MAATGLYFIAPSVFAEGPADFLFVTVFIIWCVAGAAWSGTSGRTRQGSDYASIRTSTLVQQHDYSKEMSQTFQRHFNLGTLLFIASLPLFIAFIITLWQT